MFLTLSVSFRFFRKVEEQPMLPPTKRLWNSAPRPRPSTNVKLDSARPAKKKSKVNTNLFGPVESSSKADTFPNSWVSCPRCEMVLPGPQFLPIHFAVYHRPDVATNHQSSLGFSLTDSRSQSTNFGSFALTPVMRSNGEDVSGTLTPILLFYQSGQTFLLIVTSLAAMLLNGSFGRTV